ncbi:hypothetical protein BKA65DRAFT_499885 [Rhexocercosporidium sp. MPI-PUGE-AT-0058]|nr:hypothetical protein BKA65DRAFT_499885 [Rhexocercosporidium sp. MPI-PUGE-AT-0058]
MAFRGLALWVLRYISVLGYYESCRWSRRCYPMDRHRLPLLARECRGGASNAILRINENKLHARVQLVRNIHFTS